MSKPPVTATPARSDRRRLYMPPIDTVVPSDRPLPSDSSLRGDRVMTLAFGLENDKSHWSSMKEFGIGLCQRDLPPKKLSFKAKRRIGVTNEDCKKLQHDEDSETTKDYIYEVLSARWRKKFEYDMQYVQKRYPDVSLRESSVTSSRDGTTHITCQVWIASTKMEETCLSSILN